MRFSQDQVIQCSISPFELLNPTFDVCIVIFALQQGLVFVPTTTKQVSSKVSACGVWLQIGCNSLGSYEPLLEWVKSFLQLKLDDRFSKYAIPT